MGGEYGVSYFLVHLCRVVANQRTRFRLSLCSCQGTGRRCRIMITPQAVDVAARIGAGTEASALTAGWCDEILPPGYRCIWAQARRNLSEDKSVCAGSE